MLLIGAVDMGLGSEMIEEEEEDERHEKSVRARKHGRWRRRAKFYLSGSGRKSGNGKQGIAYRIGSEGENR